MVRIRERLARFVSDRAVREAFFVFTLTRALVLVIFLLAGAATHQCQSCTTHADGPHPTTHLHPREVLRQLQHVVSGGDAGWYEGIAKVGYERRAFEPEQQHAWVFFPLHPMLVRLGAILTGEYLLTGAIIANVLFFTALVLLHKLVTALNYDAGTANRTIFYTAAGPVSYFFSVPMTESLFLCLVVASFLAATHGRWWAAGILGAFASATRLPGVLLLPALAVFYAERSPKRSWRGDVLWLALIPLGLLAFCFFLWRITGNALAFRDAQAAWDRQPAFFLTTLYNYVRAPRALIEPWNFQAMNFAAAVLALAATAFWARRRQWAFAAFTFMAIVLPLSSGTLLSTTRFVSVIFPVYIALAIVAERPRLDQAIRTVYLVFLGVMTYAYAMRFSFAST